MVFFTLYLFACFVLSYPLSAQEQPQDETPSLFFPAPAEESVQAHHDVQDTRVGSLHLDGVLLSSQGWTIWLNGRKVTPQLPHPVYEVTCVTPRQITLRHRKTGEVLSVQAHPSHHAP